MRNIKKVKFGTLVLLVALIGSACSSDSELDEARAVLEEAAEALANAEQARVDAEAEAAQAVADAAAAAAEAAAVESAAAAAVAAAAEEAAVDGDADAAAAAEEATEEDEEAEPIYPGLPGLADLVLGTIPIGIIPDLLDLTCPGDPSPTDVPAWEWGPSIPVHIDGDGVIDYANIIDATGDTGRWYLHVTSSWHDTEFYLDLGPDSGEVDFDIQYITDINENDREEVWVYSMGMGGTHSPMKHRMVVLHGCSLTEVGSNLEGHEDQFTIWLGLAPDGHSYYVSCSTFEGEPLFTYYQDYPVGGGFWAISPLPFRLVGATLELVVAVELEGGIVADPPLLGTRMNCPNW